MLAIKHKPILIVLFSVAAMIVMTFGSSPKVYAASARCYAPLFAGAGPVDCATKADHFPSSNGKFDPDHCYTLRDAGGFGEVYFDVSCDQLPFKTDQAVASCKDGTQQSGSASPADLCKDHGGTITATSDGCDTKPTDDPCHNVIVQKYINPLINFLGIGFGIIVTIMVVIGGIQYTTSAGDPQRVAAAKSRIMNAIIALLVFAFMYAILQWIVPGGIF